MNFNYRTKYTLTFLAFQAFFFNISQAQDDNIEKHFDQYRKHNYQEKIYITTDREQYLAGELMWFKVYCLDATQHQYSDLSRVAYIELVDGDTAVEQQAKIELKNGIGSGSFYLPTDVITGKYQLRGYTNWMKNYNEAFFFQKDVDIINSFRKIPYVSSPSDDKFELKLFPEGGNLVAGIESQIAFKGSDKYGNGVDFKAYLLSQENDTILEFYPAYVGMGTFTFTPDLNGSLKIVAKYGAETYNFNFPKVLHEGISMHAIDGDDQVQVSIKSTKVSEAIYFLSHARNIVTHSDRYLLKDGELKLTIPKDELINGINHFTIFDELKRPVGERLVFKKPGEEMSIGIEPVKDQFLTRERVNVNINTGKSDRANLSISVFKLDSLNKPGHLNIVNYLYLISDLKGKIEQPDLYFSVGAGKYDIDLLMLVNGWSRFKWEEILNDDTAISKKFIPENYGHIISAKISDGESKQPVPDMFVYASVPGKVPHFYNSKSNDNGELSFETDDLRGQVDLIVQTNDEVDSGYVITIEDPFSNKYLLYPSSPSIVSKDLAATINRRSVGLQTLNIYRKKRMDSFSSDADNKMFFGNANQSYLLDDYTRFTIMEDVMREYVPGVWVRQKNGKFYFKVANYEEDLVYSDDPLILFDGVPVFDTDKIMRVDPLKVKRLEVVTSRYFYRRQTYDGIVNYTTYNGDLDGFEIDPHSLLMKYEGMQLKREFYSPGPAEIDNKRLPDFRNLLYWSPEVVTDDKGNASVDFYTGDEVGKFLIVVEGLSEDGKPGFADYEFEVGEDIN